MKKNAAIYARVSSAKQKEGENIQSQISALVEYASRNGLSIPSEWIFKDEGYTGSILQRPSLDSMREIVQEGIVDVVLIYSPDRLSRKYAHQLLLEMEFQKRGVEIVFLNCPKAKNPEEQLSIHFKSIFAEYERAQIVERCRRGRLYRAKQGSVSAIPHAPLGYDYIKKSATSLAQYVINKDAPLIKNIFSLYVHKHLSIAQICRELEKKGILSPRGNKKWSLTTIRDILRNSAYIGTAHFGKSEPYEGIQSRIYRTPKGIKRQVPIAASKARPNELWIPINVPQIISESDFEIAQIKLEDNIKKASRNTRIPSILQGLLVCGYCGGTYYKKMRSSKYAYYCCGQRVQGKGCCAPSVRQEDLDTLVWAHIIELLKNPQLIEQEIERRVNEDKSTLEEKSRIKELEKELLRLSKAKDKLLDAYQDGECLTLESLKERLKAIDLKYKAILKEKSSLEVLLVNEDKIINIKTHMEYLQEQLEGSKNSSVKDRQNVLRLLVDEIVITGDQIEIKHCIPCHDENFSEISPLRRDCYTRALP